MKYIMEKINKHAILYINIYGHKYRTKTMLSKTVKILGLMQNNSNNIFFMANTCQVKMCMIM